MYDISEDIFCYKLLRNIKLILSSIYGEILVSLCKTKRSVLPLILVVRIARKIHCQKDSNWYEMLLYVILKSL